MARKKIFMITVVVVFIILYIKIIFGVIQINSHFEFQGPSCYVTINGKDASSNMYSIKQIKIIPYLLHYNSEHFVTTEGEAYFQSKLGEPLMIEISPYRCYSTVMGSKKLAACLHDNSNFILEDMEEHEYEIDSMKIQGGTVYALTSRKVYEGKFRNDITDLLTNKARYTVVIYMHYQNISSEISIIIDIV